MLDKYECLSKLKNQFSRKNTLRIRSDITGFKGKGLGPSRRLTDLAFAVYRRIVLEGCLGR
jgi:hypothetical protein